ncbi:hypothetical protein M422DRAFT_253647 [Sphaerobolus stellatus SS14]|uniref:Endonuclease/exonuclease/phosphatase domain-containing protein n=1 Tax=Sphaerobolus stellatus (strain SS14) TaxID=990650 RepID=A0A0C9UJ86_SPHS4|nr:hypothetical protein M422DRAFT_253647 [Sphaerobolus stellatus SS14]
MTIPAPSTPTSRPATMTGSLGYDTPSYALSQQPTVSLTSVEGPPDSGLSPTLSHLELEDEVRPHYPGSEPTPSPSATPLRASTTATSRPTRARAKTLKDAQNATVAATPEPHPTRTPPATARGRPSFPKETAAAGVQRVSNGMHGLKSNFEELETELTNHINAMSEEIRHLTGHIATVASTVETVSADVATLAKELRVYGKRPATAAAPTMCHATNAVDDLEERFTEQEGLLASILPAITELHTTVTSLPIPVMQPTVPSSALKRKDGASDHDVTRNVRHRAHRVGNLPTMPGGSTAMGETMPTPAPTMPSMPMPAPAPPPAPSTRTDTEGTNSSLFGPGTWPNDIFGSWREIVKNMARGSYFISVAHRARLSNDGVHALIYFPNAMIARDFERAWTTAPVPGFERVSAIPVRPRHNPRSPRVFSNANPGYDSYARTLSISSWNINGSLALKLNQSSFWGIVEHSDIIALQEAHLTPGQDEALSLPHGFSILAICRTPDQMASPHGGVAVLYKSTMTATLCRSWSDTDFMVVDFGAFFIANIYAPPASSPWQRWSQVHPMQLLAEFCAAGVLTDKPVFLLGDFNARTGSLSPSPRHTIRVSTDQTRTTRGLELLQLCESHDLTILNGIRSMGALATLPISHQHNGHSVVDYIITSHPAICQHLVISLQTEWSDHSRLTLHLSIPAPPEPPPIIKHAPVPPVTLDPCKPAGLLTHIRFRFDDITIDAQ